MTTPEMLPDDIHEVSLPEVAALAMQTFEYVMNSARADRSHWMAALATIIGMAESAGVALVPDGAVMVRVDSQLYEVHILLK